MCLLERLNVVECGKEEECHCLMYIRILWACGVYSVATKAVCAHCGPFVLEYVKGGQVR